MNPILIVSHEMAIQPFILSQITILSAGCSSTPEAVKRWHSLCWIRFLNGAETVLLHSLLTKINLSVKPMRLQGLSVTNLELQ